MRLERRSSWCFSNCTGIMHIVTACFLQELTRSLSLCLKEKQVRQRHQQHQRHAAISPNMSQRARRIAQTAFDLSDAEVDDLLSDDTSTTSHQVIQLSGTGKLPDYECFYPMQTTDNRLSKVKKLLKAKVQYLLLQYLYTK